MNPNLLRGYFKVQLAGPCPWCKGIYEWKSCYKIKMFSNTLLLKYNIYVCFQRHVGMCKGVRTHEEARGGENSYSMGSTFPLKSAGRMAVKNKVGGGMVDTESGEELKQLLWGRGRAPPENRGSKRRISRAVKVKRRTSFLKGRISAVSVEREVASAGVSFSSSFQTESCWDGGEWLDGRGVRALRRWQISLWYSPNFVFWYLVTLCTQEQRIYNNLRHCVGWIKGYRRRLRWPNLAKDNGNGENIEPYSFVYAIKRIIMRWGPHKNDQEDQ